MSTPTESAAQATLSGVAALFVAALGVEPQAVAWALCGSVFGAALAKTVGTGVFAKVYGLATFVAATLICAMWATMAADQFFAGSPTARNAIAPILAVAFHPILDNIVKSLVGPITQAIGDAVRRRFGG